MSYISNVMGWILARLSELVGHNFAASVLVFTILVNLLMLPLSIKTQKSTVKQTKLKPKLDALKKKYGNDRQKMSQATSELYTKEGVSMSGGCMPMIVRLLVMMGVYWAVVSPLTYVLHIDTAALDSAKAWTSYVKVVEGESITADDWAKLGLESVKAEQSVIDMAKKYNDTENVEKYAKLTIVNRTAQLKDVEKGSVQSKIKDDIKAKKVVREVEIVEYLTGKNQSPAVREAYEIKGGKYDELDKISFDLFGLDLTQTPKFSWNFSNWQPIWIIPLISFLASLLQSLVSSYLQKKNNPDAPGMAGMMIGMSVFSLWIAFSVPGAVGFYWACSSLIAGGIQTVMQIVYSPAVVLAKDQAKNVVNRAKQEQSRIAAVDAKTNQENS